MESLDIKVRSKDYLHCDTRTAFIELIANTTTGKVGWSLDKSKRTDWILFLYLDTKRFVLYNARQLRAAVIKYLPELKQRGKESETTTKSYNGTYKSTCIIVSHQDLALCIRKNSHGIISA